MAQIIIDIPVGQANRVLDAIAARRGYTGFLADGITPQTKAAFAKVKVMDWIKNEVADYEERNASIAAATAARAAAEAGITLS